MAKTLDCGKKIWAVHDNAGRRIILSHHKPFWKKQDDQYKAYFCQATLFDIVTDEFAGLVPKGMKLNTCVQIELPHGEEI